MSSKLRGIWGIRLPRRGYRIQPRVSPLGNFNLAVRPEAHKALPRSALVEKHPSAGLEVLKGRKICLGQSHTYRSSKRISSVFSSALRSDFRRRQKWISIFGGENNVDQDQSEGLSHALNTHALNTFVLLSRSILRPY